MESKLHAKIAKSVTDNLIYPSTRQTDRETEARSKTDYCLGSAHEKFRLHRFLSSEPILRGDYSLPNGETGREETRHMIKFMSIFSPEEVSCRHYTFYLWKDIIAAYPMAKFCLIPLYIYAFWSVGDSLRLGGRLEIWILIFWIGTSLALAPAWLIEFRYFSSHKASYLGKHKYIGSTIGRPNIH